MAKTSIDDRLGQIEKSLSKLIIFIEKLVDNKEQLDMLKSGHEHLLMKTETHDSRLLELENIKNAFSFKCYKYCTTIILITAITGIYYVFK